QPETTPKDFGPEAKLRQRVMALDIICAVSAVGIVAGILYMMQWDGPGWRFSILANSAVLAVLAIGFFGFRRHVMVRTMMLLVSMFLWVLNELAFGQSSGLHYLLMAVPAIMFYSLGAARWWLVLIFSAAGVTVFLFAELFVPWATGWARTGYVDAFNNIRNSDLSADDILFAMNVIGTQAAMFLTAFSGFYLLEKTERALQAEYARSEALLLNLLPSEIAARLKLEPDKTIADKLPNVAVLFADIVDFTPRAASLAPDQVVSFLSRVFTVFDELAERHGLEKIKTIGDSYMVAAGMPSPVGDPAHRAANMALDMLRVAKDLSDEFPEGLELRIGLHAGPVVAGVIGNRKLFYDVWGETVNTASRMESHGMPGRIQVTKAAFNELKRDYTFAERGMVDIKGVGEIETWWLTGKGHSG
ncbi:MAG: adenylate/guanylate cyclase domain-containing protein, partial [Pseudomonadota bacterium]